MCEVVEVPQGELRVTLRPLLLSVGFEDWSI